MTATYRRRAAGFTLIELLVVVALLAVLAALGAGAYFRIRSGQQQKLTEDTVSKLQSAFQSQWTAELNSADDAFKGLGGFTQFTQQVNGVKQIAGGDLDRAKSLWAYLWMKNAYPQTVTEAINPTTMTVAVDASTSVTVSLPARPAFSGLAAGSLSNADQAAVVFYRALTQKAGRGQAFNAEAIGALSKTLEGTAFNIFTDTYGAPISYVRMSSGIQNDAASLEFQKAGAVSADPLDPAGRLKNWPPPSTNPPPVSPRQQAAMAFGMPDFTSTNWMPTVVSRAGAPTWTTFLGTTTGIIPVPDGYAAGYKLRRMGGN